MAEGETRRDFLKRLLPRTHGPAPEPVRISNDSIDRLFRLKVPRRRVLKVGAAAIATVALDQIVLDGLGRYYLIKLATDPKFQKKLWNAIKSGELFAEDIPQLLQSRYGEHPELELGKELDFREDILDDTFPFYAFTQIAGTDRLILIARIGHVEAVETDYVPFSPDVSLGLPNVTTTMERVAPGVTLPGNQVEMDTKRNHVVPRLYAEYAIADRSIVYEDEKGGRRPRGGGVVLVNNQLFVVTEDQIMEFVVGKDRCQAVEHYAFSVHSRTKDKDLDKIAEYKFSGADLSNSPRFDSFLISLERRDGTLVTFVISTAQHIDTTKQQVHGKEWDFHDRLTVRQACGLLDQLVSESDDTYVAYTLVVPDPEEQSWLITSDTYEQEDVENGWIPTENPDKALRFADKGHKRHRVLGSPHPVEEIPTRSTRPVYFVAKKN